MGKIMGVLKNSKGSTSPLIIIFIMIIVVAAAFITDIGYAAFQDFSLYSATKQAAVIGAETLIKSRSEAEKAIKVSALKNAGDLTRLDITIPDNNREITVSTKRPFEYFFVKYIGIEKNEIAAKITVRLSGVMGVKDVRPFGVLKSKLEFGEKYVLTNNTVSDKNTCNIIPLQLGNSKFKNAVMLGYPEKLKIGDSVETILSLTGNNDAVDVAEEISALIKNCRHNPVCTFQKYENSCSRIIIVPVLSEVNDQSVHKISGFAAFFLEECRAEGDYFYITGRFIKHTVKADMSDGAENFGLAAIKIIEK